MKTIASVLLAAGVVALLYLGYKSFQNNTATILNEQHKIDSLTTEVAKLDSQHIKKDSVITVYKDSVVYVDRVIETEKTKYVKIKHKYDEIRNHVVRYTPNQLDSFFANRYGHVKSGTLLPGS